MAERQMTERRDKQFDAFAAAVRREFRFLEEELAFPTPQTMACPERQTVRYQNNEVWVDLCYGTPEFEPMLSFGQTTTTDSYGPGDLMASDKACGREPAHGETGIAAHVAALARQLRDSGMPLLRGDPAAYEVLARTRREQYDAACRAEAAAALRVRLQKAWEQKVFSEYTRLFKDLRDTPTELEKQRFAYAAQKAR